MGAHSTIYITKEFAMQKLLSKLINISDKKLLEILDDLYYDNLYNFRLTGDKENNDNHLVEDL